MAELDLTVRSEAETARLAAALAPALRPGDALLLVGDLAAGKTRFVTALVGALGSDDAVTSPTFTLAQFYATRAGRVMHLDAYRLEGLAQFRDLGLDDLRDETIAAVEWGDRVATEFPGALTLALSPIPEEETARRVLLSSDAARWDEPLRTLEEALA